jgi:hypothetical protein
MSIGYEATKFLSEPNKHQLKICYIASAKKLIPG